MEQYEKDYQFQKKGKKYKVRYFDALKELFGGMDAEESRDKETKGNRSNTSTDSFGEMGETERTTANIDP